MLLPNGENLAATVGRKARECGADPVIVITPRGHEPVAGCITVENPNPASDQIASLRLGLTRLANTDVSGVLVWPVDCPFVRSQTIESIIDAAVSDGAEIVIPNHAGRNGHPTWFAREIWPELMVAEADGAREVVRRDPTRVQRVAVSDASVLTDIDTREDLDRALTEAWTS